MDIFLASGNQHKFGEFIDLLIDRSLVVNFHAADLIGGMPDVEESGATLEDNARIKAGALLPKIPNGAWVLSDDSGLLVDALEGAPGVRSARYAGEEAGTAENNAKLLKEMESVPDRKRTGRFRCVLCFTQKGGEEHLFAGDCEGRILTAAEGEKGFGYDPLFVPDGHDHSFAVLGSEVKNKISHRGRAFDALADFIRSLEETDQAFSG